MADWCPRPDVHLSKDFRALPNGRVYQIHTHEVGRRKEAFFLQSLPESNLESIAKIFQIRKKHMLPFKRGYGDPDFAETFLSVQMSRSYPRHLSSLSKLGKVYLKS